mgnify:CR=1 FL=1
MKKAATPASIRDLCLNHFQVLGIRSVLTNWILLGSNEKGICYAGFVLQSPNIVHRNISTGEDVQPAGKFCG